MFYIEYVKMCEDFAPNFGVKGTGCCITTVHHHHTSIFTREFLTKNNVTAVPTHPTFLFPQLKIKLKGRHFDTTEVMETESQAVLNTLAEHDFQDAFRIAEALGTVRTR
jgi:hypothetical protein